MELRDYLRILQTHWVLIFIITVLGAAVGVAVTMFTTPQYSAEAKLYVSVRTGSQTSGDLLQGSDFARQNMATFVQLATTERVLQPVVEELDLNVNPRDIADQVDVSAPSDSTILEVEVTDENPAQAAQLANELGDQLRTLVEEDLEPARDDDEDSSVQISMVQSADEPTEPVSPRPGLNLTLGILLGLILGVGLAVLRAQLDTRIRSSEDIERLSEAPVLGRIGHDPKAARKPLIVHLEPQSPRAEAFRALRTNIQFLSVGDGPKTYVISSSGPDEGKTTTSTNLALALAETGMKVALVDCDLRRPRVAEYLGLEGAVGLTDALIGRVCLDDVLQRWGSLELHVLPAGQIPPNPSELLGSGMMDRVLKELENTVDIIILDAPPVLPVTDAVVLGAKTQGMIFVAAAGRTKKTAFGAAVDALKTAGVPLRGVIATMLPSRGPGYYGAYAYTYGGEKTSPKSNARSPFRGILRRVKSKN